MPYSSERWPPTNRESALFAVGMLIGFMIGIAFFLARGEMCR